MIDGHIPKAGGVATLRVLGSGDAFNSAGAQHSAYLLNHESGCLLLECGPGILAAMKRDGIDTAAPDVVLISHLHGDHFGGLPFLFLEYTYMARRDRPLVVAGPPTTARRVVELGAALYGKDMVAAAPCTVDFVELVDGARVSLAGVEVEAFEVPHEAEPFSLGYRLGTGSGSMLFSGDSAWTDRFVDMSAGTDLFLCECCTMEPAAADHTNYRELRANSGRLGCRRLMLTHLGQDVRAAGGLEFERAHDGMSIELAA